MAERARQCGVVGIDFKRQPKVSKDEQNQRIDDALKEVGLADAADKFPSELSGGMAQRAVLARGIGAPTASVVAGRAIFRA